MTRLIYFSLLIFLMPCSFALYIKTENSYTVTEDNFDEVIKGLGTFMFFVEEPERFKAFLELVKEVAEVAQAEESSKHMKFGIVDCTQQKKLCARQKIVKKIELKFFGKNNHKGVSDFLDATIEDVLREEELIKRLDEPGNCYVLFKVNYCPYCKEAMDEWIKVIRHFRKNSNVFVSSIDCTRHRPICAKYDALKFPRIRFIHTDVDKKQTVENFDLERNAKDMIQFCEMNIKTFQ